MITLSLGSMGSGIGAAFGVAVARPDAPVVSICGDGFFAMGLGDVATAAQERVGMVVAVLNDERYGMVEAGNNAVYGRTPAFPVSMSVSQLAEGVGARAAVIEEPGQIRSSTCSRSRRIARSSSTSGSIGRCTCRRPRLEFLKKVAQSGGGAAS